VRANRTIWYFHISKQSDGHADPGETLYVTKQGYTDFPKAWFGLRQGLHQSHHKEADFSIQA
jgi:hypothetical protein